MYGNKTSSYLCRYTQILVPLADSLHLESNYEISWLDLNFNWHSWHFEFNLSLDSWKYTTISFLNTRQSKQTKPTCHLISTASLPVFELVFCLLPPPHSRSGFSIGQSVDLQIGWRPQTLFCPSQLVLWQTLLYMWTIRGQCEVADFLCVSPHTPPPMPPAPPPPSFTERSHRLWTGLEKAVLYFPFQVLKSLPTLIKGSILCSIYSIPEHYRTAQSC